MRLESRWTAILLAVALTAAACTNSSEEADPTTTAQESATSSGSGENGDQADSPDSDPGVRGSGFSAPVMDETFLEIGSDIRVGALDNGLTYYVMENDSPGQSVSMRLAVKAGGFHENPQGTGIAHFLEHMMFNGTTKYPGNTIDTALRSIGAEIGPDFNAYTSATETVYQIKVEDSGNRVETAVDILAQWASEATLDPGEVAAEAPIVREELRLRESGEGLVNAQFDKLYHQDTPFADVAVAGTAETINATTPEVLRAYYDTWYRPDNMAVVIVGDRDVDDLERLVVDSFSAMEARGLSPDSAIDDFTLRTEPIVDVIIEPTYADASVSVDVPLRAWNLGTKGGQKLWVTEILHGVMINSRIDEGIQTGRLDLERGFGQWFGWDRGLQYMGFNAASSDLEAAAEVLLTEIESSIKTGFTQAELDRAVDIWRNIQEQRLLGENDISDDEWANNILEDFLDETDLQSIEDSVAMNLEILDNLNIDEVNNHWGWAMTSAEPIVATIGPDEATVGDAASLVAALQRARDAEATSFDDDIEEIAELMGQPEPVREVALTDLEENPGFSAVFENGMQVIFSPSTIDENNLTVLTVSPGGKSQLAEADARLAEAAVNVVNSSGVGPYSAIQKNRYLSSRDATARAYVDDYVEGFFGGSPADELEILLQLMYLGITEPTAESVKLDQQIEAQRDQIDFISLDSAQAATVALVDARSGGAQFAFSPTSADLTGFDETQVMDIYNDRFQSLDEHIVYIVGDADERDVLELARAYIGSLPDPRPDTTQGGLETPGDVSISTDVGSGSAAGAYRLLYAGSADETVRHRVLAEVADNLLNDRVFSVVREELGATYGGSAFITFNEPGDSADLTVSINGDPARIDEIGNTVTAELEALGAGQIDPQDFEEAVTVVGGRYNFINNGFILESLFDEAAGGEIITRQAQRDALEQVTIESLSQFIASFLTGTDRIEVKNVPS